MPRKDSHGRGVGLGERPPVPDLAEPIITAGTDHLGGEGRRRGGGGGGGGGEEGRGEEGGEGEGEGEGRGGIGERKIAKP